MKISVFRSRGDTTPFVRDVTWEDLAESLSDVVVAPCTLANCLGHDRCMHKKRGRLWSPAEWPAGVTRSKKTVAAVHALIIDLDDLSPDSLEGIFDRLDGCQYVLHASHSDRPAARRVRLVLALTRPVTGADWPRFWAYATGPDGLNVPADPATKDASRMYYTPSRPRDGCADVFDGSGYDYASHDGAAIDVDAVLAAAPPAIIERDIKPVNVPQFPGAPSEDAWLAAVDALGEAWAARGHRHSAHLALAGALARAGWPVETIADFAVAVAEIEEPGNGDLTGRLAIARSTVEKVLAGSEDVTGWPRLAEYVDEAAIATAQAALGLGLEPDDELADAITARARVAADRVATFVADAPAAGPSRLEVKTALEAARDRLKKARDPKTRHDAKLLDRVVRGQFLTEHADEDRSRALVQAAIAVARSVPTGTPAERMQELLLTPAGTLAGDVPEVVALAVQYARSAGPIPRGGAPAVIDVEADDDDDDDDEPEDDRALREALELDDKGRTRNAGHNIERIIRHGADLRDRLRFNLLSKQVEVTGGRFAREDPTSLPVGIKNWLASKWSLTTSTEETASQLLRAARVWHSYDPVADYLNGLTWDGVSRLDTWLTTYCLVVDAQYARRVGAMFLISAVARALDPGCKVDSILILEGDQGAKKSTTLSILGGAWFSDTPLVMGDKDSRLLAACKWICELAELKSLLRDFDAAKGFITQKHDDFRPPYGRAVESFLRRCVFGASTNEEDGYLPDMTGNRRYWAVKTGKCDVVTLQHDRDQLWAEAVHRYRSAELNPQYAHPACPGERWWFEDEEAADAAVEIDKRREDDAWYGSITTWVDRAMRPGPGATMAKTRFTAVEIAEGALDIAVADLPRHMRALTRSLRGAGMERVTDPATGARVWVRRGVVITTHGGDPVTVTEAAPRPNIN